MAPRRRTRRTVRDTLTSRAGLFDLASILVGVAVVGIVSGGAILTIQGLIPWSQDREARDRLVTVTNAESVALANDKRYLSPDELAAKGYLDGAAEIHARTGKDGTCYAAVTASATGAVYFVQQDTDPARLDAATVYTCLSQPEMLDLVADAGGPAGLVGPGPTLITTPQGVALTGPSGGQATLTWEPVTTAESYRVEVDDGDGWRLEAELPVAGGVHPTTTVLDVTGAGGGEFAARVAAEREGEASTSSAPQRIAVPGEVDLLANPGFEKPLTTTWLARDDAAAILADGGAPDPAGRTSDALQLPAGTWVRQVIDADAAGLTTGETLTLSLRARLAVDTDVRVTFTGTGGVLDEHALTLKKARPGEDWLTYAPAGAPAPLPTAPAATSGPYALEFTVPAGTVSAEVRLDGAGGRVAGTASRFDAVSLYAQR